MASSSTPIPPAPPGSLAPRYLIPCGLLLAIGLGLCIARVFWRYRSKVRFGADDYLIVIGTVSYPSSCGYGKPCALPNP